MKLKYNQIKDRKQTIRTFLRAHYTDEKLAALLAHLRDGKFSFFSCCCLIGIPTANHALQTETGATDARHYHRAKDYLAGADAAESALHFLGSHLGIVRGVRIYRYLLPMVRAEIKRRDHLAAQKQTTADAVAVGQ